jgi:hypothetical protein
MAKRFCDTDLWKTQRWFRKLPALDKLAFCYIKDLCDYAGLWKIDCSDLVEDLGLEDFNIENFVISINTEYDKMTGKKSVKERVKLVNNNILWLTGFIQFQYEGKDKIISYKANAVRGALWILYNTKINPSEPFRTLPNPSEQLSLLEYGIEQFHIKVKEPLPVFVEGLRTLMDKDKDKDNISLTKSEKNGKFSGNFKSQGEELYAQRIASAKNQIN